MFAVQRLVARTTSAPAAGRAGRANRRLVPLLLAALVVLGAAFPAAVAGANSLALAATYDVNATLGFAAGTLTVRSTARVTNDTQQAVEALSFNLLPLKVGSTTLQQVLVGETAVAPSVSGQTLTVALPAALAPGASVPVTISYKSRLATSATDKNWMFAKLNGVVTAYRWIPWLSRATRFKRPNFGDPFVTATSPDVRVSITSDRTLKFAASGRRTSVSGLTQTFAAEKVRDFNFAASPRYTVVKGRVGDVKVRVFTISQPGDVMLKWAKRSLNQFNQWIGAYPYPRFVVAQSEGGTGMESPGMIWIPRSTRSSNLAYLIAHETAHQWFYAVIGNDQAREPYSDEAPADFLARELLSSRRASRCNTSVLDGRIYDYGSSCYYEVIYIQGGNYLHNYRQRVGAESFWSGMRSYYQNYRFRLGGTRQLLETLDAAVDAALAGGHAKRFPRYFAE